jgi:hypothetical protein
VNFRKTIFQNLGEWLRVFAKILAEKCLAAQRNRFSVKKIKVSEARFRRRQLWQKKPPSPKREER